MSEDYSVVNKGCDFSQCRRTGLAVMVVVVGSWPH